MKDQYLGELLSDFDALLLGLWVTFHYSPKKSSILESIQSIYGEKHLRILKAATTCWLTQGQASKRVIDCYRELLETMDMIYIDTNDADIRGYRNMLMSHKLLFCICLMTDILAILNTLSLALQKQGVLLVDINSFLNITLEKLKPMLVAKDNKAFNDILSPQKSYYAEAKTYINILKDFQSINKHLRSHKMQITLEQFHDNITLKIVKQLMKELCDAFQTSEFPKINSFNVYHPKNILPKLPENYGIETANNVYAFYGENKIDVYEERHLEAPAVIKCDKENFVSQSVTYFQFISKKKNESKIEYEKKLEYTKNKLCESEKKKKCTAKLIKQSRQEINDLEIKVNDPVSISDALLLANKVFPDVTKILNIIAICPASGAVAERGFSLMNLIMNDLRNSINIRTLDALMRISYSGRDLTDDDADKIRSL